MRSQTCVFSNLEKKETKGVVSSLMGRLKKGKWINYPCFVKFYFPFNWTWCVCVCVCVCLATTISIRKVCYNRSRCARKGRRRSIFRNDFHSPPFFLCRVQEGSAIWKLFNFVSAISTTGTSRLLRQFASILFFSSVNSFSLAVSSLLFLDRLNDQQFFLPLLTKFLRVFSFWNSIFRMDSKIENRERNKTNKIDKIIK